MAGPLLRPFFLDMETVCRGFPGYDDIVGCRGCDGYGI